MKKQLVGLVIAFISLAVLGVSGCTWEYKNLDAIKCDPERRAKKLELRSRRGRELSLFTISTAGSSSSTWKFAKPSGTSGCGEQSDEEPSAYLEQQKFVAFTIDNLSEDIARGGGPHLRSLTALLGCPDSDYPALADMARQDFGRLFPSAEIEPEAFLARLKDDISHDSRLAVSCTYA